jgi:hypothetical protein
MFRNGRLIDGHDRVIRNVRIQMQCSEALLNVVRCSSCSDQPIAFTARSRTSLMRPFECLPDVIAPRQGFRIRRWQGPWRGVQYSRIALRNLEKCGAPSATPAPSICVLNGRLLLSLVCSSSHSAMQSEQWNPSLMLAPVKQVQFAG